MTTSLNVNINWLCWTEVVFSHDFERSPAPSLLTSTAQQRRQRQQNN
jgi:hypothetical protein